jgi:hypothetical protein
MELKRNELGGIKIRSTIIIQLQIGFSEVLQSVRPTVEIPGNRAKRNDPAAAAEAKSTRLGQRRNEKNKKR